MVGGGQLARMTHQAAIALGQTLRVLAASPDDPAAQVSPDVVIGAHTDLEALQKAAAGADALTFDHEHVPTELLEKLVSNGFAGQIVLEINTRHAVTAAERVRDLAEALLFARFHLGQ